VIGELQINVVSREYESVKI